LDPLDGGETIDISMRDTFRVFWEALKDFWDELFLLALMNIVTVLLAIPVVTLPNIRFYTAGNAPFAINPTVSLWIRAFWVAVGFLWLILQMYPMALLLEQEDQRLRVALRNTGVLFIANPGFTLVLALLLLIVGVISTFLPMLWFLVTPALLAVVCNKAVLHLLEPYRKGD